MMLKQFYVGIYAPRRLAGVSPNTLKLYNNTLRRFDEFLKRSAVLADLNDDIVCRFVAWRRGLVSAVRTNQELTQLRALSNFAFRKRFIDEAIDVPDVPEYRRVPTSWTPTQVAAIINAALKTPGDIFGLPKGLYFAALTLFIYDTGLRIGAALNVLQCNVDLQQCTVYVAAESQKNRQDQLLKFHKQTRSLLVKFWQPTRKILFPGTGNWDKPYTRNIVFYAAYHDILATSGLPHTHRDMFQRLRRTCATLCKAGGADATVQLGHSSDAITRPYYLAPVNDRQAGDSIPRLNLTLTQEPAKVAAGHCAASGRFTPGNKAAKKGRRHHEA